MIPSPAIIISISIITLNPTCYWLVWGESIWSEPGPIDKPYFVVVIWWIYIRRWISSCINWNCILCICLKYYILKNITINSCIIIYSWIRMNSLICTSIYVGWSCGSKTICGENVIYLTVSPTAWCIKIVFYSWGIAPFSFSWAIGATLFIPFILSIINTIGVSK